MVSPGARRGAAVASHPYDERRPRISTAARGIGRRHSGGPHWAAMSDDAAAVVRSVLELAGRMDVDGLAAHLADDVVMELPYAPDGYPKLHDGKAAVMRFQRAAARDFTTFS